MTHQAPFGGSIRTRLLTLLLLGAAVAAVVLYFIVQSVALRMLQSSQDNILSASTQSILDSARIVDGQVSVDIPYFAFSMLDSIADERVFYAIRLGEQFLSGYEDLPEPEILRAGEVVSQSGNYLDLDIRLTTSNRVISTPDGPATLQVSVGQSLQGATDALARVSRISMALGAGFFALTAILAWVITGSTIRPLNALSDSLSRRGAADLRPVRTDVPSEMSQFVVSLNGFIRRLKTSLSRSEDFIAEAAHRIRTPLAIVRTQAETTLRQVKKKENKDALREIIRAIDESSRSAGQILDHAMVSIRTDHLEQTEVDLPRLVLDAVERLRPVCSLKDITLHTTRLDEGKINGDLILLESALANLLDNSMKYTPEGGAIDATIEHVNDRINLVVEDTGSGFATAEMDDLKERFVRGESADGIVGSGLGLTIAHEIVTAHGGEMKLSNSQKGGACVTLSFPLS